MKSAVDRMIEQLAESQELTIEQATKEYLKNSDYVVELDKVRQEHNWIDRGLKLTCESPAHPTHEVWKRRSIVT